MQLLGDVLKKASGFLDQKKISEPRLSAEWLLATLLGMNRVDLYLNFDRPLTEDELSLYRARISRRVKHEPISYIIGSHVFYGLTINVDRNVLIPRHETEELVELVIRDFKSRKDLKILDLCTGSGAIACALKHKLPDMFVSASDVSEAALNIAKQNARALNLEIAFFQSDLLSDISGKFDVVISNPPYIAKKDINMLHEQVVNYEPHIALFGGEDGLEFYRLLKIQLPKILNTSAMVYLEIGYDQGQAVTDIFNYDSCYSAYSLKDTNQNHRFVVIEYKG